MAGLFAFKIISLKIELIYAYTQTCNKNIIWKVDPYFMTSSSNNIIIIKKIYKYRSARII